MILVMQEVLSRSENPQGTLRDQEFYELNLSDSKLDGKPVFYVREARARWDEQSGQIVWDEEETDRTSSLEEAKKRYEERKLALARRGFVYSDMELF
jgi:hypothetical protein